MISTVSMVDHCVGLFRKPFFLFQEREFTDAGSGMILEKCADFGGEFLQDQIGAISLRIIEDHQWKPGPG